MCLGLLACSEEPVAGAVGADALDPANLVLLTDTRGEEARAGIPFKVDCRAFRRLSGSAVTDAGGDGAAGSGGYGEEVALPSLATLTWVSGPGAPLAILGNQVTLAAPGVHRVRCGTLHGELDDPVGADLPVIAGPPAILQTKVVDADGTNVDVVSGGGVIKAGTDVRALCSGSDTFGNAIKSGWKLKTIPDTAAVADMDGNFALSPTKAGSVVIACMLEGSSDTTPAKVDVVANVPKHLFTLLDPDEIEAGNATKIACVTTDAHGNPVANFPVAVDHSDKLQLKGLYLSATEAGLHSVRCVPETLAWSLFTLHGENLHVVPAAAAQMLVGRIPDKGVYKRKENIKFTATVRDSYGNIRLHDKVDYEVVSPAKGYKDKSDKGKGLFVVQFNLDGTYDLRFWVLSAPDVQATPKVLIDGAPPLLSIDYPPWGSTLDGKPSVVVEGKAGDEGSGIKSLLVNGKAAYPDGNNDWKIGRPSQHGLNFIDAVATDLGDEQTKAVRGYYYAGNYYDTDAGTPKGAMVKKALQIFVGKDFFDDGVHDKNHPDDMATLIEVIGSASLGAQLLPGNLSSGDVTVTLSNTKVGPLAVKLVPKQGGLHCTFEVSDISTDLSVKAKLKLGPIKTSIGVSGDIKIAKVRIATFLKMQVLNGYPLTEALDVEVSIDGMKLHVDGLAGLFDFVYNLIIASVKGQIEAQVADALQKELPKALAPIFDALAINQSFEVPPSLGTGKTATVSLVSEVKNLQFSPLGMVLEMDASFVSQKGVAHTIKGSIGRDGCVGTSPDAFEIDTTQRLQFALHDDLSNQLLYAIWYGGAMATSIPLADLAGTSDFSGFSLEGATMDLDFLLPPIIEACNMDNPMAMRIQVGDLFATMRMKLGADPLDLYNVVLADVGLTLGLGKDAKGDTVLTATLAPEPKLVVHLMDISKGWEDSKAAFADLIDKMLKKALTEGSLPFGQPIETPLPTTEIDLSATIPGVPPGVKMSIGLTKLQRAGGYTSIVAEIK